MNYKNDKKDKNNKNGTSVSIKYNNKMEWPSLYDARVKTLQFHTFRDFIKYHKEIYKTWDCEASIVERRMMILVITESCLKFNYIVFKKYQVLVDNLIVKFVEAEYPDKEYIKLIKRLSKKYTLQAKHAYIQWVLGKTILTNDCITRITSFIE